MKNAVDRSLCFFVLYSDPGNINYFELNLAPLETPMTFCITPFRAGSGLRDDIHSLTVSR
jgi:hypothetical protein